MARKKVTKASKRRLLIFGSLSIALIIYFLVSLSTYMIDIYNLKKDKKDLEKELIELQAQEESLGTQIEMLKDVDYLARYARENYLYSKDGEIVLKIEDYNKDEETNNSKILFDRKHIFYAGGGMIGILFLYVILKKAK